MILVRKPAARRGTPLVLTSVAALATAFMAPSAFAQTTSFNAGNPTVTSGSVTFDRGVTTPGTEVYTVNSRTAVLDFTPNDTAPGGGWINFQNAGTTVRYTNGANTPTFTVLNRIVPTDQSRPIQFNGRVISEIRSGQTVTPGGDVWFYSPGGIVLGATAAFDIGSLLLTTRDPTNGTGVIGSTTQFRGGGATGSFIDIQQGVTINASNEGSYVALMSPLVRQFGSVRVNGSAAYVAGEDATVTINNGLFDISVATGTDTGNGFPIIHQGTTGGPASTGASDPHRIYMVAVPKNTAITLLVNYGSRLGFDAATSASIENGRVILSSGRMSFAGEPQIVAGGLNEGTGLSSNGQPFAPAAADVHMYGDFTSSLYARAWTNAYLATGNGSTTVTGDVYLRGGARAHIGSRASGATTSISGDVRLNTDLGVLTTRQSGGQTVFDQTSGEALIYADNGGTVTIGGSVIMTANASVFTGSNIGSGPLRSLATGGSATIFADNGTIRIGGSTSLSANATMGNFTNPALAVGDLQGGLAGVSTSRGGTVTLNGATNAFSASANAFGTTSVGNLFGGNTFFNTNGGGGAIQATGSVLLSSLAADSVGVTGGGDARGGTASVFAGGAAITIGGNLSLTGYARGGSDDAGAAGWARGGTVSINGVAGSSITVGGSTSLDVFAQGGSATGTAAGAGGAAVGGEAIILGNGNISLNGLVNVAASATGGDNARSVFGGSGGSGTAGNALIRGMTGTITLNGGALLSAIGTGGSSTVGGGDGGNGQGGGARIDTLAAAGRVNITGAVSVNAGGAGGAGLGGTARGGSGTAGRGNESTNFQRGAYIFSGAGAVTINGTASLSAIGRGGAGGIGGVGRGGNTDVSVYDGAVTITGLTSANSNGFGGAATSSNPGQTGGAGGDAFGGEFYSSVFPRQPGGSGAVRLGAVNATADAFGGAGAAGVGGAGGRGGAATAGFLQSYGNASSLGISTGDIYLSASANGGAGGAGAAGFAGGGGGLALGGNTNIGVASGTDFPQNTGFATFGNATLISEARGGTGGAGGANAAAGVGGDATAGSSVVLVRGVPVTVGNVSMSTRAFGGAGSVGGAARGGQASLVASTRFQRTERGRLTTGTVTMTTAGVGGAGATNGASVAGFGLLQIAGADATIAGLDYTSSGTQHPAGYGFRAEIGAGTVTLTRANIQTPGLLQVLMSAGGVLRAPALSLDAADISVDAQPGGPADALQFGDLTLRVRGNALIDEALIVTGALSITADGQFDLQARLSGRTVSVTSAGINIGVNGSIGGADTQSVLLANGVPGQTTTIGGADGAEQGYVLNAAELGRVRANQIEVRGGTGAVLVRNLSLGGSAGSGGNLVGQNAEFRITGDVVRVEGGLSLQNAATTDTLSLIGARRVEVVTDQGGSVSVTGVASGDVRPLAGALALSAPVIGVGTNALLTQLAADPRFSGRNALLAAPPTTPVTAGYVQANQLILTTTNVAAIQNSGTAATFGGFTAGLGGLLVRAPDGAQTGSTPAQVVVYGRVQRPNGGFYDTTDVGGGAAFATGQQALFDRNSTVNGCAVGATCGSEPAVIVATVNAIEEVLAASTSAAIEVPAIRVVQIVNQADLAVEQIITEPVSGAGNASLWDTGDDEDEDEDDPSVAPAAASGGQTR